MEDQSFMKKIKKTEKSTLVQPKMRYRARTDLERIFEVVNNHHYGNTDKSVLNENLSRLDPIIMKKKQMQELKNAELLDDDFYGEFIKKNPVQNISIDTKSKFRPDNSHAKMLMKELYNKTHFKAASTFSLFGNPKNKHKFFNSNSSFKHDKYDKVDKHNDNSKYKQENSDNTFSDDDSFVGNGNESNIKVNIQLKLI